MTSKARANATKKILAVLVSAIMVLAFIPVSSVAYASNASPGTNTPQQNEQATPDNTAATDGSGNATADNTTAQNAAQSSNAQNNANASSAASATNANAADTPAPATVAIGDAQYATIKDAIAAAKPGDMVTLLQDLDLTGAGTLNIDGLTLDLAGHTISAKNFSLVFEGSNATIENGTFKALAGGAYGLFYGDSTTSQNVTLQDLKVEGGINIFNTVNAVLKNDDVDATVTKSPYYAIWCDINSQVNVQSGTYRSNGAAVVGLADKQQGAPESKLNIMGGDFYSDSSKLVLEGANRYMPTISGGTFFDKGQAAKYVKDGYSVVDDSDGRFSSVKLNDSVASVDPAIPDSFEVVSSDINADGAKLLNDAAKRSDVLNALNTAGGVDHVWTVNVALRDKNTLEEKHDQETTFVVNYPDDVDRSNLANYKFVVLHIKESKQDDGLATEPEIIDDSKVSAQSDGLHITSTLSPFAISYSVVTDQSAAGGQDASKQDATPNASGAAAAVSAKSATSATASSGENVIVPIPIPEDMQSIASDTSSTDLIEPHLTTFDGQRSHTGLEAAAEQAPAIGMDTWLPILFLILAVVLVIAGVSVLVYNHQRKSQGSAH